MINMSPHFFKLESCLHPNIPASAEARMAIPCLITAMFSDSKQMNKSFNVGIPILAISGLPVESDKAKAWGASL